ncbi:MAG: hypothetical protein KDI79_08510 [Anaerolineae bacterium]|nr:hypothetical protein [Anaerolineae bacterium]
MKQYIHKQLDAVLNVGFAPSKATQGFQKVGHDEYIEGLQDWLRNHQGLWTVQPNLSTLQSLKDRGVDFKVDFPSSPSYVAVFQVKSHGDLSDKEFSSKLWQQIGQSGSYKFDQLYIILCGDLTNPSHYQKVNGFVATVEQGDYPWITIISPRQAWQLYSSFNQPVDLDKVRGRLTVSVSEFLMKLNRSQELHNPHSILANLEKLYVPPAQYPAIRETLKTKGFVVIVGDPQLGKTYTAINLLYEYYLQGYEPHWVLARNVFKSGDETPIQEVYHNQGLEDVFSLERFIRPNHILYLEDPFGSASKQDLELVNEKNLFKVTLLLDIYKSRSSDDTPPPKIVVTSRSAIFRQALKLQPELEKNAIWLRVGDNGEESGDDKDKVSYSFSERVQLAEKYEHLYQPTWLKETSAEAIEKLEYILSLAISTLWTPHSLQIFFQRSTNITLDKQENLEQCITESLNIAEAFAKEIALLPLSEQLVFVIIYLINFQKANRKPWQSQFSEFSGYERYIALIQTLDEDEEVGHLAWQEVIENYPGIIELIEGSKDNWPNPTFIRFRHPVYENAVSKFLSNNPVVLDRIFARIPALLQTTPGTHLARNLIGLVRHWHHADPAKEAKIFTSFLNSNDVTLLTELAKVYAVAVPFVRDVVKSAIRQLVSHPLARGHYNPIRTTFIETAHQLIDMPMDQRCEILLTGLDNGSFLTGLGTYRPYDLVCRHYNEVTEEAREHLKHHLNQSDATQVAARSLANYFDHLPKELQEYTENLATTTTFSSYLPHKELISGLILGFGRFNNDARHLIRVLSNSQDFKTRAYLASALVLIYDQLDEELLDLWHHLAHEDISPVAVAAASRIIELKTQGIRLEMLKNNNLPDFTWQCARSSDQFIRAAMLTVLLDNRKEGHKSDPLVETLIKELIHDDAEVVRAATLYHLLTKTELQSEFPGRLDALTMDDTAYAQLSKLIVYTNQAPDVTQALSNEVETIRDTDSKFLHNALVFHISVQSSFLSSSWQTWLTEQLEHGDPETVAIIQSSKQLHNTQRKSRPIFEPDWFLDYANGVDTIWCQPKRNTFQTSTGYWVSVSKVDELNLVFHMRQQFPDYLEC